MELAVRQFKDLTIEELYEIFKVRISVFVVEQNCPYQEIDEIDKRALHMYYCEDQKIKAYLRIFADDKDPSVMRIGRVLSAERRKGYASSLMKDAIAYIQNNTSAQYVVLEAQVYARSLYDKLGFTAVSDEFLEDGIPHIKMQKQL